MPYQEKICIACKQPFQPEAGRQVRCRTCMDNGVFAEPKTPEIIKKALKPSPQSFPPSTLEKPKSRSFSPKTEIFPQKPQFDFNSLTSDNVQREKEKNQRISIRTFVSAGMILLEELGIGAIEVESAGLKVSVKRIKV